MIQGSPTLSTLPFASGPLAFDAIENNRCPDESGFKIGMNKRSLVTQGHDEDKMP